MFLRERTVFVWERLQKPFGVEVESGWESCSSKEEEENLFASEGELAEGIRKRGENQWDGTDQKLHDVKSSGTFLNS